MRPGEFKDVVLALTLSVLVVLGGALSFSLIEAPATSSDKLQVVATFYPLAYFAGQIGGDRADIVQLMQDNADPHAWEPKPSDILKADRGSVFVYNGGGFEPWAESFIASLANRGNIVIVDTSVNVTVQTVGGERLDPHFWLDPLSAKVQVQNILYGMSRADPGNAAYFAGNAANLTARLDTLDHDFRVGLQNRTLNDFVTTHEGFDYLAVRYGLTAHAAVGISAEEEPSPADLTTLTDLVRSLGIHYVFSEPIFSDAVVETIAAETGAHVLVLDGIHGRSGSHADMDYFQIMYANIAALRIGLEVTS